MERQRGARRPRRNRPCTYRNHCQQRARRYHHPWLTAEGEEKEGGGTGTQMSIRGVTHRPPAPFTGEGKGKGSPCRRGPLPHPFPSRRRPLEGAAPSPIHRFGTKEVPAPSSRYYHKRQWMGKRARARRARQLSGGRGGHAPAPPPLPPLPGHARFGQPKTRSRSPKTGRGGQVAPPPPSPLAKAAPRQTAAARAGLKPRGLCNCHSAVLIRWSRWGGAGGGLMGGRCPERAGCLSPPPQRTRGGFFPLLSPPHAAFVPMHQPRPGEGVPPPPPLSLR